MSAPPDRGRLPERPAARAGRPGALAETGGLLLWILLFAVLQSAAGKDITAATANALAVQAAERAVHIDIEESASHWLAGHLVLSHLAVYLYRLYYAAIIGVLSWVFIRHAGAYRKARRVLVAMTVLILPVYWAVPESPPRFALPGVIDIVARYDILGHASRETGNGQNHYSAMPSLHVGLSLWCAYAVWSVLRARHPRLALLPWLFPLLMAADVLATGNHYVLDVTGSIVLLALSIAVVSAGDRLAVRRRQARPRRPVRT
jgi:membrane-associated phospholipid phosphatase